MKIKHIPLFACTLGVFSASASAQFTTAVVPPREKAKVDTVLKRDSVRAATIAVAARVTDMKKWVDSAAGVSMPGSDSATSVASTKNAHASPIKDSVMLARNAKLRVDSAATIATVEVHDSTGLADSAAMRPAARPEGAAAPTASAPRTAETTRFAAGAPAPATASALPLVALIGVTTLLMGAALRRP